MALDAAETAFLDKAKIAAGLHTVLDYDPENITVGAHGLPAVTLYPLTPRHVDLDIRGVGDLEQPYRLSIYVSLQKTRKGSEFKAAEAQLRSIADILVRLTLGDRTLGGACLWSEVVDDGEDPVLDLEKEIGYSSLTLTLTDVAVPL